MCGSSNCTCTRLVPVPGGGGATPDLDVTSLSPGGAPSVLALTPGAQTADITISATWPATATGPAEISLGLQAVWDATLPDTGVSAGGAGFRLVMAGTLRINGVTLFPIQWGWITRVWPENWTYTQQPSLTDKTQTGYGVTIPLAFGTVNPGDLVEVVYHARTEKAFGSYTANGNPVTDVLSTPTVSLSLRAAV
jgi:hypothetical protein